MFHVTTDNELPYRVCGGQQDSGSACVASRGNDGQITFRDWHPVGVEEYGYAAPDPLNPDIVYGGKVTRYDRRTGAGVERRSRRRWTWTRWRRSARRGLSTAPYARSRSCSRWPIRTRSSTATTCCGRRSTAGIHWRQISPDLTRERWSVPKNVGTYAHA